jgi:formylglycine-generating enzyme required for sulfatase activity
MGQEDACAYANGVDLTLVERFPNAKWENIVQCRDGRIFTAPVGSFRPNGYWTKNYEGAPADGSPRLNGECGKRVNRGGSWTSTPTGLRSTHRDEDDIEKTRVVDLGFRVARDL